MNHTPHRGTCLDCGKQVWATRKDARRAARRYHPSENLHPYPCPAGNAYHIGHLRPAVIRGHLTRARAYRKKTA